MEKTTRSYSDDWSVPTSFGIWGGSAGERARLAWAIARRIGPEPYWLNVEESPPAREPEEEEVRKGISDRHFFAIQPAELAPHNDLGNMANWVVRDDTPQDERLRTLADFMRLPDLARRLLVNRAPLSPTDALVIANANRTQPLKLYSGEEGSLRPLFEATNHFSISIIITITNVPLPASKDVDYLLQIDLVAPARTRPPHVSVSQGAPAGRPGLFTVGQRLEFEALLAILQPY